MKKIIIIELSPGYLSSIASISVYCTVLKYWTWFIDVNVLSCHCCRHIHLPGIIKVQIQCLSQTEMTNILPSPHFPAYKAWTTEHLYLMIHISCMCLASLYVLSQMKVCLTCGLAWPSCSRRVCPGSGWPSCQVRREEMRDQRRKTRGEKTVRKTGKGLVGEREKETMRHEKKDSFYLCVTVLIWPH